MLLSQAMISFLWLVTVVSLSSAEELELPDEVTEIPVSVKPAFARHASEISDLLHMFITLIKRADEEEGRELGLPEITTTVPLNIESASIEELFDRFETAAQSFRARFLKYLKTTEAPYSSVVPTFSTEAKLNQGEDVTNYAYEHENEAKVGSVPDYELKTQRISTADPDVSSSDTNEKRTLAFILSNADVSDAENIEYSSSSVVPLDDIDSSSEKTSVAFILSNEEIPDSEMEAEHGASTVVPDASDSDSSNDKTTFAFIISNKELRRESGETSPIDAETSDKNSFSTLVPITEENLKSFIDETSFKSSLDDNFETSNEQYLSEVTFDLRENGALNQKPMFTPTSRKYLNGAATLMFESTSEGEDPEIETATSFSTADNDSEEYTFMTFSSTEDNDSEEETTEAHSTTEDDSDEATEAHSTTEDDSDEATEAHSTTEDDSEEAAMEVRSTTEDDSDEETMQVRSTTEEDSDEETMEIRSTADELGELSEESTSTFISRDVSSIEELNGLLKILREAAGKDNDEESGTMPNLEEKSSDEELSDSGSLMHGLELFPETKISKAPETSIKYSITSTSSTKGNVVDDVSLNTSSLDENSEDVNNQDSVLDREGLLQKRSVYSHLEDVIGAPGEHYPNYTNIPATSFTCEGKESPGLYADLETRCQVFHACWPLRIESYLCPVGSTFNQRLLSCDYWFNSTCSLAPDYYNVNLRLRDYPVQVEDGLYEYFDERDVYPYNFRSDHSHPIFNEMKFLPFMYKIVNYSIKRRGIKSGKEIDYNETIDIKFDDSSTLPTLEDVTHHETTTHIVDSVKDRFRELLRAFVASEMSKSEESSDEDSSLTKTKLQERKYIYEKMSKSKLDRSGVLPDVETEESTDAETKPPQSLKNHGDLNESVQFKNNKEQIAAPIVFKVLETAENVVSKGILPLTRDMLAANYIKLYKRKKL